VETAVGAPDPQVPGATPAKPASSEERLAANLRSSLHAIRKRWPLVFLVMAAVVAGVMIWTYRQPKIYQASCSVVIEPVAPQVLEGVKDVVEMGAGTYWADREFYETQYRIIRSKDVMKRVVDRLGLAHDPDYPYPGAAADDPHRDVAQQMIGLTNVVPVRESRIANIVVDDRDAKRAAQIANTIAHAYIEGNLEFKLAGAKDATVWLGDQVVGLADKLKRSELALYDYRRKNQLLDINLDAKQSMTTQNVQTYNQKLADVRARRIELESNRKLILAAKDSIEEQESLPEIRQNTVIQQLRVLHVELTKSRAELESKYGERHPNITAIDRKLASLRQDYAAEISNVLKSNEKAYQALVENERALLKIMEQEKKEALELAKLELEYRPLARDSDNNQRLYSLITQRQKETSLTGLIKSNNIRILDPAVPKFAPVKPHVLVNLALSLVTGLLLGIGLAVGLEALDSTLKSQEHTEAVLGVPVLGMVPIIGERGRKKKSSKSPEEQQNRDLGVFRDQKSAAAEACRSIRTNLLFLSPDRPPRSIVITSPGPQEGKTTTAISMAITTAQAGARILLIDTDLRRPRIHRAFGMSNDVGISSVIVGEVKLDDAIFHTQVPGLDVLPCGPVPPNPAELLHTQRFRDLMKECAERYDRVIYDSPPTSAVTDPVIIGNLADGVILVVRAGMTARDAAAFARRQIADAKARLLGAIVNLVDPSDRRYDYYYSQYHRSSRYGGYYGYGSKSEQAGA
jgi:capsular exopolysaccharide synthesis family protein